MSLLRFLRLLPLLLLLLWVPSDSGKAPLRAPPHNCRLCGVLRGPLTPPVVLPWILDALRPHGAQNRNGWGVVWFPMPDLDLDPIARRGGPPSHSDTRYPGVGREAARHLARAVVGHVRLSTSVLSGIPDPHPFVREGLAFAHNGTINRTAFHPLVQPHLNRRPVDHRDTLASSQPELQCIDSELLFIYLLAMREQRNGNTTAAMKDLAKAVRKVDPLATVNLVVSDGRNLWALSRGGAGNLLRWFHDPFTHATGVASEGVSPAWWGEIPDWTLLVAGWGKKPKLLKM